MAVSSFVSSRLSRLKEFGKNDWLFFAIVIASFVSYIAMIAILVLIPLFALVTRQKGKLLPKYRFYYLFLAFSILAMFSTFAFGSDAHINGSVIPAMNLKLLSVSIVLLSFDFFFFSNIATRKNIFASMKLACVLSILALPVGLYQFKNDIFADPSRPDRFASVFINENCYGTVIIFVSMLCICFITENLGKKSMIPYVISLVSAVCGLWLCKSRMAYIAVALGILILIFFRNKKLFFVLLGIGAVFAIVLFRFPTILPRFDSTSEYLDYRISIWKTALEAFCDNFVFGRGYITYSAVWEHYYRHIYSAAHAHNLYIDILLSFGITGFLTFGAFVVCVLTKTLKLSKKSKYKMDFPLVIALIAVLLFHGMADISVLWPQCVMYPVFMLLLPSIYENETEEKI